MPMQAPRGVYIFNPLDTLALEEDEWLAPRPAPFTPRQDRVPILQETGCPRGRSGWAILPALCFDPPDRSALIKSL